MKRQIIGALLGLSLLTAPPVYAGNAIGYGQGTQVDAQNVPLGATDFNTQYGQYDAYATTPDTNRIILTFDQGYENGYTAGILDTLAEKNVRATFFVLED